MTRALHSVGILTVVLMAAVGCRTMTGETVGEKVDDTTTTANVKAKLAADRLQNLGRVSVETRDGVVYLVGILESEEQKERAAQLAATVPGVRSVVDNIQVRQVSTPRPAPVTSGGTTVVPGNQPSASTATVVPGNPPAATTTRRDTTQQTAQSWASGSSAGSASPATTSSARYALSGQITDIDLARGFVTVRTPEQREMQLYFPPSALQGLNRGDRVTVDLGINRQP